MRNLFPIPTHFFCESEKNKKKGYEGEDNALYCLTPGNPLHSFSFFNSPASCRHQTNVRCQCCWAMLLSMLSMVGHQQGKKGSFEATAVQRTTFCT